MITDSTREESADAVEGKMMLHEDRCSFVGRIFLNVTQLSEILGVPKTWIYDRTRGDGPEVIPHAKFGKYIRFDPMSDEFVEWVEGKFNR